MASASTKLRSQCDRLRSLHQPGKPLLLPNVWDVATARAVVKAGFPVVATTSWGVSATLGYDDHEVAPAAEMLAAAGDGALVETRLGQSQMRPPPCSRDPAATEVSAPKPGPVGL